MQGIPHATQSHNTSTSSMQQPGGAGNGASLDTSVFDINKLAMQQYERQPHQLSSHLLSSFQSEPQLHARATGSLSGTSGQHSSLPTTVSLAQLQLSAPAASQTLQRSILPTTQPSAHNLFSSSSNESLQSVNKQRCESDTDLMEIAFSLIPLFTRRTKHWAHWQAHRTYRRPA